MRIYTIKRKGANVWYNLCLDRELIFSDNDKVHAGLVFFRKKDAMKYLDAEYEHKDYFEVVGATVDSLKK